MKSKVFLDPHFNADLHLSQTGSNFNGGAAATSLNLNPHARSASTQAGGANGAGKPLDQSIPLGGGYTANAYKAVDPHMSRYGEIGTLSDARKNTAFKSYNDFTKRFDQTHLNTKLRHPYI